MNCENCAWLDIACIAVIGSEYRNWFTILIMNIYQNYQDAIILALFMTGMVFVSQMEYLQLNINTAKCAFIRVSPDS